MGCCFSRSAGPNSPYPGGAPESSRAITAGPATEQPTTTEPPTTGASLSGPASQRIQQQQQRRRRRDSRPLDQHINKPLRRQEWVSTTRPWSKRQLARERSEYFHTRVTGRAEVWQTIHAALRILWEDSSSSSSALASSEGEQRQHDEDDATGALATAQTLLSAADISLPTGLLSSGVYDSLGNYYPLPQHIVCDPVNVIDDGLDGNAKGGGDDAEDTTAEDDDESDGDDVDVVKSGKGKGKGVVEVVEKITVRARLSENGWDYAVKVNKTDNVRSISRKIAEQASLPSTKKLRIAYMGKILKENISLEAQGWQPGHIVNGFVFFQTSA